jgi:hypothetical protein
VTADHLRTEADAIDAGQDMGLPVAAIESMNARATLLRLAADEIDGGRPAPPITPDDLDRLAAILPSRLRRETHLMAEGHRRAERIEADAKTHAMVLTVTDALRRAREANEDIRRVPEKREEYRASAAAWMLVALRLLAKGAEG